MTIALRTQQILSEETGVPEVVDPLAGSVHIEHLTGEIVRGARKKIEAILDSGGAMEAIKRGDQQRAIHESAWSQLTEIESGTRRIIGVNHAEDDAPIMDAGQPIDPELVEAQLNRIDEHRKKRDHDIVAARLESFREACESDDDLFPHILDSVRNGATVGEVMDVMRDVFGTWRAPSGI